MSIEVEFKTKKAALEVAVSLSKPSKTPCKDYSLPTNERQNVLRWHDSGDLPGIKTEFKTKKAALEVAVSLSKPSKMPCKGYSLPAAECKVGSKLRKVCGSVCEKCYAFERGNYIYSNVQEALYRRLEAISDPRWVPAMIKLIDSDYFRWHDSGDLQSMEHLKKIVEVCKATPATKHWLPTKEASLIKRYIAAYGAFPENLTVRLSAAMIDGPAPTTPAGVMTSTVHGPWKQVVGHECPAYKQDGKCNDCRACWDKSVQNVSYLEH